MPRPKPALSDEDLLALLRKEEQAAAGFQDGTLAALRRQALAYYDRQPYGDEQEGASQVVTSEFADVIESLMPGLMRVFTAADDLVRFTPGAPGQEKWAEEASAYVPHVLMRENDGFRIISGLLKDALMYRLSGVTVDLEEVDETRTLPVQGLPQDAIDLVMAAAEQQGATVTLDLEPEFAQGRPAPMSFLAALDAGPSQPPAAPGEQRLSGTITLTHRRQRVAIENIAPEDIRFSPGARTEDKASFLGFIKRVTASDLVKLGLNPGEIDDLNADRPPSTEEAQRNEGLVDGEPRSGQDANGRPDSERPLWLVVAYIRADTDGDGKSELERVVYAHGGTNGGRIIERMPWEGPAAIALATPILMPHSLVGRSLFDQTQDLQLIGSVITRGLLDNLYLVNRPRPVISDHVNIDSLIDWTPGSPIRLRAGARPGDNHVAWLQVPNVTDGALTALEHLATVRENRTGVSRYNQGLDADSLNKTLGGLNRIMSASQQRQDLIARVFAETAIKRLYRLIYRAIKRAAAGPLHYWPGEGGAFVSCDPSQWPDDMDLSVDVVGIGNREQALGHLALVGSLQEKLIALQGGANGPFVTVANIANAAQKLTATLGYRTSGLFFQSPEAAARTGAAGPPSSPVDATLLVAQAEIEIMRDKAAAEIAIRRDKARADVEIAWFKARQRVV
ncbi:portal protein [Reyranella soli]|uniref:Phage portal protein n=1 Tax=Reyranella soli TaxID=1230389 RepID=A0A512NCP5_9HYPH|nr:hypothetical protein [Reyranella soli]GEP56716.1 hypothetical protein RSO01_38820 [Reyranella soli]